MSERDEYNEQGQQIFPIDVPPLRLKNDEWMFDVEPQHLREIDAPPPYFDPLMVMAEVFTQRPTYKDPEAWKALLLERATRPSFFDSLMDAPDPDIPAYDEPLGTTRRVEHTEEGIKVTMDLTDDGRMVIQSLDLENAFNKAYDDDEFVGPPPTMQIPKGFEPDTSLRTRTQIVEIRKGFSEITKVVVAIVAVLVALTLSALSAVLAGGLWVFWKLVVEFVKFIRHIVEDLDG